MNTWKPNPRIVLKVNSRVKGLWHGQPFHGLLIEEDGFGYHIRLDRDLPVYCPEKKFRLAYIIASAYAGVGFNIESE